VTTRCQNRNRLHLKSPTARTPKQPKSSEYLQPNQQLAATLRGAPAGKRSPTTVNKSRARTVIEQAIAATTDPQKRADLAVRLASVTERESRTRGRQQRIKARAKKEATAVPADRPDDGDEPFEITWPPAAPATQPEPTAQDRADAHRVLGLEAPAEPIPPAPPARVLPENGKGWSRTLSSYEPPVWWDPRDGWLGATENGTVRGHRPEYSPESPELCGLFESTGSLQFVGGEFVNPAAEKRAEDAAFLAYGEKCFGK
jgi:hypothetical protein